MGGEADIARRLKGSASRLRIARSERHASWHVRSPPLARAFVYAPHGSVVPSATTWYDAEQELSAGRHETLPPQVSPPGRGRTRDGGRFIERAGASVRFHPVRRYFRPATPVRIITHSAPGGSPDALLRIVADRLSQTWGRQVLALNHPGAGGAVAARMAAAAAPDGYTLYMPASSAFVTLPGLQANLPLEVPRDFVPVGFVGEQPFFVTVSSSLGVRTLPEFIPGDWLLRQPRRGPEPAV